MQDPPSGQHQIDLSDLYDLSAATALWHASTSSHLPFVKLQLGQHQHLSSHAGYLHQWNCHGQQLSFHPHNDSSLMFHESSDGYGAIEDDMGGSHTIRLPNSFYTPEECLRLLFPQHWAQRAQDNNPNPRGTRCVAYADCIELKWNQRKFKQTVPLSINGSNVATI